MEKLCMNCMGVLDENQDICPHCLTTVNNSQETPFLPKRTVLAKRYIIGSGLDMDGEGLSYVGYDESKKQKVYIREFYPSNFCSRRNDFTNVKTMPDCIKVFDELRSEFLKYFRAVARLRNLPAITAVYDVFEENNTAYIICQWVDGTSLCKYLGSKGGHLEWGEAKTMFMPFLSSLSHMEASGVRHLGISPDNIIVTPEKTLKLTGFATKNLRTENSLINSRLYEGCSALEQYLGDYDCSESTDVYGFAASLFLTLSGEYPPSALSRRQRDKLMMPQNILSDLPENVVSSLAVALRVYPNSRTLSFETLRIEFSNSPLLRVQDIEDTENDFSYEPTQDRDEKKSSGNIWGIVSCISALAILLSCLGIYWFWLKDNSSERNQPQENGTSDQALEEQADQLPQETQAVEKIIVPNLVGRNLVSLQNEVKSDGEYRVVLLSEEFNDSIGEGCVVSQTPGAGEEMEKGSTIAVNVSKGTQKRTLPYVSGKTLSEASQIIANAKLRPTSTSEFSSEYPEGEVIGYKNHKAGENLDYDSEVVIIVSKGAL